MTVPVSFVDTEIQRDLRQLVTAVVNDQVSGDTVRSVMLDTGVDDRVYETLVQSGVHALLIAEDNGGAGAAMADAALVSEVLATRVTPVPYLSAAVIIPTFLQHCEPSSSRDALLHVLAAGTSRATLVYRDAHGSVAKPSGVRSSTDGDRVRLNGVSAHVLDGAGADTLIVVAITDDGMLQAVIVPRDTTGVTVTKTPVLDLTRPLATVMFNDVQVAADAVVASDVVSALTVAKRAALVALSHEAVGGLNALLTLTTAYAKQRLQFGRAIGSFQAVKHRLVDVLIAKEAAQSAAVYASRVFADDDTESSIAAFTAAAYCLPAYVDAALACLQIFGGIGFTWEHDVHLHIKRAKASSLLFGSATHHRRDLAQVLAL
ncbi:MAG: acyl-CoA dehydrogenase [Nitriliruptoraceae bacterium]